MSAIARTAFALLLAASAAFADSITFDPPNPTPATPIAATVHGTTAGCSARQIGIATSGSTITLRLTYDIPPDGACGGGLRPFTMTFHLGLLPEGTYTVIARHEGTSIPTRDLATATLDVRNRTEETYDIGTFEVPTSGGLVTIANPFSVDATSVVILGVSLPVTNTADRRIVFNAPPHAAGVFDMTVLSSAGTAKGALVYFVPASPEPPPPAAAFEPILFPVAFEGPGAFGSQWTTQNFVGGDGKPSFRDAPSFVAATQRLANNNQPWGLVLHVVGDTVDRTFFASRARDLSRQAQSAGVEIPVVRQRDFRVAPVDLLNVPNDSRFRANLRIWTMEDTGLITVAVGSMVQTLGTTRIPSTSISFASADITDMLRAAPAGSSVRVQGFSSSVPQFRAFSMITITNNETQEFTVISSR